MKNNDSDQVYNGQNLARLVVYRAAEYEGPWEPVKRDDVPDWVKNDPELIKRLIDGWVVENRDDVGYLYRAEKFEEPKSKIILQ